MTLSKEIISQIETLSKGNKHSEIVTYLGEKLIENPEIAADILDYATKYHWPKNEIYVINADTINRLGVAVNNLADTEQKKLCVKFYALAAERGSSWGNHNYASNLLKGRFDLEKSSKNALKCAKKAVALTKDKKAEEHQHKFLLFEALKENELWREGVTPLVEYFEYIFNKSQSEKDLNEKQKQKKQIAEVIKSFSEVIEKFATDFDEINQENLTDTLCQERISALQQILKCVVTCKEFEVTKNNAHYFKGKYHEKLGENSEAWIAYCSVSKENENYNDSIAARASLLKSEIARLGGAPNIPLVDSLSLQDKNELENVEEKSADLILPQGIVLPDKFGAHWEEQESWFHSVNEDAVCAEFEKRSEQVKKLIAAKEAEIELIQEILEINDESDELKQKNNMYNEELKKLKLIEIELEKRYKKHLPHYRKTYRRHMAEVNFFNPSRSRKIKEIIELAKRIIDFRYKCSDDKHDSIKLTGKSARLYISAERIFQEAVLSLNGNNALLGIPKAREKPWTIAQGWDQRSGTIGYGPVESYQVGNTTILSEHRTSPKRQRLGDSFLPEHGTYSDSIYPFLSKLAADQVENEKMLVSFIIRYGKNHQPVTLKELQAIYQKANESDVHEFNKVCFLIMEKEQAQWHSATDERFQLGMSVAQARCLMMIQAGFIGFKEAFKNKVFFGVYSCTGIINDPESVAKSCQYIDDLYMVYLQNMHLQDGVRFFKKYINKKSAPIAVLTRQQAHLDMKQVYGGDSDTDDEGYDTEISMNSSNA